MESYKSLRPEPAEQIILVLERISAQLSNSSELELEPTPFSDTHFIPSRIAVPINTLWFGSLALSLASAFVGLTVKQWLADYTASLRAISHSRARVSRKQARARQWRHDALHSWKVHGFRAALSVLILLSLIPPPPLVAPQLLIAQSHPSLCPMSPAGKKLLSPSPHLRRAPLRG